MPAVPASTGRDSPAPLSGYFQTPGRLSPKLSAQKSFFLSARREEASPLHFILCVQRSAPRRIPESIQTGQSNMCARPCGHTANPFRSAHTESRNTLTHFCHASVLVNEIPGTVPGPARFHHTSACRGPPLRGQDTCVCRSWIFVMQGKRPPAEEINLLTGSSPFCCAAAERKRTTPGSSLCTFFCHVQIPDRDSPVVPSRPAGRHHGSMLINKKQEVCYERHSRSYGKKTQRPQI